jgi:hypothetical protein
MNGYDTVFANAKDEELEFETMFDQEDDLIDTIVGCNECGDPLTGADPCPVKTADERSSSDDNPDYEKDIDGCDTNAPSDAEGTVGYDFETKPEIGSKSDESTVDAKDVKVEEGFNFYLEEEEGESEEEPTEPVDDKCNEGFDFSLNEADNVPGIDKDVQSIENGETYLDDDAIEDVESEDPNVNLNYDISDEEVIDFVMNN